MEWCTRTQRSARFTLMGTQGGNGTIILLWCPPCTRFLVRTAGVGFLSTFTNRFFNDPTLQNSINKNALVVAAVWIFRQRKNVCLTGWTVYRVSERKSKPNDRSPEKLMALFPAPGCNSYKC